MLWYHLFVLILYLLKVSHTVPSVFRCFDAAVVILVVVVVFRVVWLFLFDFWFFFLFFLSSLLVFLLWWPGTYMYTLVCLVATLGDRTLSWVRFDWCFVLITGITRTSFVVVPRKLLSFSCCATPLLFLFSSFDAVDLRWPLRLRCPLFSPTFWHSCWIRKNYRFGGSWSTAGNPRNCHGTFLIRC